MLIQTRELLELLPALDAHPSGQSLAKAIREHVCTRYEILAETLLDHAASDDISPIVVAKIFETEQVVSITLDYAG